MMKPLMKSSNPSGSNNNSSNNGSNNQTRKEITSQQQTSGIKQGTKPRPQPPPPPPPSQQPQTTEDLDTATALLMNTQLPPELATNLATLAAADPTLITSLPILLALQAHNQAALNELNARDQNEGFSSQKKPNPHQQQPQTSNRAQSSSSAGNKPTNPSPTNQPRSSPGDQAMIKKRKQSDDLTGGLKSSPVLVADSNPSGLVAKNDRPKIKQVRKDDQYGSSKFEGLNNLKIISFIK